MLERLYFVYMLQSSSRRALYIGFTNFLIARLIEHRTREYPESFTAKYRAWRLVYYEEYGDAESAHERERQLKGWSRTKKNALVQKMNPKWRDIMIDWENKYGLEFRLDGRIQAKPNHKPTQDPSTPASRAGKSAREPSSAQDG
jgi:putative endonuclease